VPVPKSPVLLRDADFETGPRRATLIGNRPAELGLVHTTPGFTATPAVINGFSDLILRLWGPDAGSHARSAVGMAELPFSIPVEIEAEVEIDG
jgi:hypothetical protein